MLILNATTKKLEVVLGQAVTTNQLPVVTSWRDVTTTDFTPGSDIVNTNNTTDATIVAAPAASTQRIVDYIGVYNNDTTAKDVSINLDVSGTNYLLIKVNLLAGERLEYQEGRGWASFTNNGSIKQAIVAGSHGSLSSGWSQVVLGSDVTNNNAVANTIADITGFSFSVNSGSKYWFRAWIMWTSAAGTTGARFAMSGPTMNANGFAYRSSYALTATTETVNHAVANDIPAASNASPANTGGNIAQIEGFAHPSANGTIIGRFASEVSSSAIIVKAGSILEYQQVA